MTESNLQFEYLRDAKLASYALSPAPVWLWSADADRILWANPTGASIFDAASLAAVAALRFGAGNVASAQILRLAATLPKGGAPRLERLRGFGASIGGTLICMCSRVTLAQNGTAVLVVSTERAGKNLALPERASRLLEDVQHPAAIFTADGELIETRPAARALLGDHRDLIALGAEKLAREASLNGSAEGEIQAGHISMLKLGAGSTFALLVVFTDPATTSGTRAFARAPAVAPSRAPIPVESKEHSNRVPFRFVWQTDAEDRFSLASQEFANLLGPKTAAGLDRNWIEIAQTLNLDPQGQVANALSARETFSGVVLFWPADHIEERLAVEMSGLPVFDRDRQFKGFRGFGICRNVDRLEEIRRRRAAHTPAPTSPPANEAGSKVLPFPSTHEPQVEEPRLTVRERSAFQELARELSERLKKSSAKGRPAAPDDFSAEPSVTLGQPARELPKIVSNAQESRPILDRLPVGILVYRLNSLIYANRAFLEWTGYSTLEALNEAGGLDSLFIESKDKSSSRDARNGAKSLTIATINGAQKPVEGRLFSAVWNNENALVLMIDTRIGSDEKSANTSLRHAESENRELRAILDTATDGVLVLDLTGRIISANRSAEALFGYEPAGHSFGDLLAPECRHSALEHLDRLAHSTGAGVLDAGYEAIGRVHQGGLVPLYITLGRIEGGEKLCVVLRDITVWKHSAEELANAKQTAEKASIAKSEFLAKISHEIRTPLNAIIGFSEVMVDERFGPVGNERYRQYLKDIRASGGHLMSLLTDLVDLSKIEAGKLELTFVSVNLNDVIQQCVAIMQQQASRERVIIRTSLSTNLPQIVADARSMRQIALNLLSNSIKFTHAGGQVIVSTALTDNQEVVLRVRDTGIGMNEKDLESALEPFRQVATAVQLGSTGSGLGLPITKALVEANQARFRITSKGGDGTLVEVVFPVTRVLAQ
ncbi:MAG: PAS domain-containing protein [Pseudolabrys sp.]